MYNAIGRAANGADFSSVIDDLVASPANGQSFDRALLFVSLDDTTAPGVPKARQTNEKQAGGRKKNRRATVKKRADGERDPELRRRLKWLATRRWRLGGEVGKSTIAGLRDSHARMVAAIRQACQPRGGGRRPISFDAALAAAPLVGASVLARDRPAVVLAESVNHVVIATEPAATRAPRSWLVATVPRTDLSHLILPADTTPGSSGPLPVSGKQRKVRLDHSQVGSVSKRMARMCFSDVAGAS